MIPIAVTTGTFYPLSSMESIELLGQIGQIDVELTLQQSEFYLGLERELHMPLLPQLIDMVSAGRLRIHALHAPHMITEHGYFLAKRLQYLVQSVQVCARLGGRVVDVHPFHLFATYEGSQAFLAGKVENIWSVLLPGLPELLEQAHSLDVMIGLENISLLSEDADGYFNLPASIQHALAAIDHPAVGLTFDIQHAAIAGTLGEFFELLGERMINLHISDFSPPLRRVIPGAGQLDWGQLTSLIHCLPGLRAAALELSYVTLPEVQQALEIVSKPPPSTR